jgi:signal peptidase II
MRERIARVWKLLLVILVILAIDIFTKYLVHENVPLMMWSAPIYPYGGIPVFHNLLGIDLVINHVTNRGGPWGMVSSHHTSLLMLRIFAILCISIHLMFFNQIKFREVPLCMIIAGALGNVLDSFFYGHVIDMIHFVFWGYSFAVFNVADASISIGVMVMLLQACLHKILSQKKKKPASSTSSSMAESPMYNSPDYMTSSHPYPLETHSRDDNLPY